jgi:CubicO group peptidase (beta-lactamase class C family)
MIQGYLHPDFEPVGNLLRSQLRSSPLGGAAVCVYHRGECVVDIWGGVRDTLRMPWQSDTMSVSFSTTKGVTATALHVMVDHGLLDYDDPVARFWPEFAQNGKDRITVRHLLCHEAGLYRLRSQIDDASRMRDWEYMTAMLARSTPANEPGRANAYHALTFGWLVGEVVRRASGRSISEVVRAAIAEPLDLDGFYVGAPADELHRAAELIVPRRRLDSLETLGPTIRWVQRLLSLLGMPLDLGRIADALIPRGIGAFNWSAPENLTVAIPAANGLFTARSLAKMYAALANGGEINGARVLSEKTLRRATEVQNRRSDLVVVYPMHWRLGYHRAATTRGTPRRAFGHYGFGGSGAWADPDRNLSMAMVLNSGFGTPMGDLRTVRMGAGVLRCADRRRN